MLSCCAAYVRGLSRSWIPRKPVSANATFVRTKTIIFGGLRRPVCALPCSWGQGDISISGIVPKKATWSGDDYNPAKKGDMVFKPDAEAKDGVENKGMTTQIFWLLKQWFRRRLRDIYDGLHLGSVSTKKKLMDLSAVRMPMVPVSCLVTHESFPTSGNSQGLG